MSADQSQNVARLREPFPKSAIGYQQRGDVRLAYVGHAATTQRLLEVDPAWTWEPLALGPDGLPAWDGFGGLWIRLTVCGITRLGYGDAQGKKGPNAVKEAIGDGIRNAAMRFGVALDLWAKEDISVTLRPAVDTTTGEIHEDAAAAGGGEAPAAADPDVALSKRTGPAPTPKQVALMWVLLGKRFVAEAEQREFLHSVITRDWTSTKELSATDIRRVIDALGGSGG